MSAGASAAVEVVDPPIDTVGDPSTLHVLARLASVAARLRTAVERRISAEPTPAAYADRILAAPSLLNGVDPGETLVWDAERAADAAIDAGRVLRLRQVRDVFGLSDLDVELLLVAASVEVHPHLEAWFAHLTDDLNNRRSTVGVAIELAGGSVSAAADRARLRPGAPLIDGGLITVDTADRPFPSRLLRVPDRVVMHLLGDDSADPAVARLQTLSPPSSVGDPQALAAAIHRGARVTYLREPNGACARSLAVSACDHAGLRSLSLDLARLEPGDAVHDVAARALLEARLTVSCLVVGPVDALARSDLTVVGALADSSWPVILIGVRSWDPTWSRAVPLIVDTPPIPVDARANLWRETLAADECEDGLDPGLETATLRLTPDQIDRAAWAAWLQATYEDRPIGGDDLRRGAMSQNSASLERLGVRVEPRATWDDLVLPAPVTTRLRELLSQARSREIVLQHWGFGRTGRGGRGLTAMFAGPSGTGKTLAAEVIAHELGYDLYTVDLAALVDKYIGETEKNLDRLFDEAERVNGVLFFDEADAMFGNRSEVRDSHDRYANLEVAYLLQRLELFDGIVMLATNMRTNIDEAFTRRMDAILTFGLPDQGDRARLWRRFLGTGAPLADDLDLDFCARAFSLSGGSIRNICLTAAYYAADRETSIGMAEVIRGVRREYEKLGQLITREEFGPYHELTQ